MVPVGEIYSMLNFSKLNGRNYYVWSDNMMSALQAQLLWLIVNGQWPTPPTSSADPSVNATSKKPVPGFDDYKE